MIYYYWEWLKIMCVYLIIIRNFIKYHNIRRAIQQRFQWHKLLYLIEIVSKLCMYILKKNVMFMENVCRIALVAEAVKSYIVNINSIYIQTFKKDTSHRNILSTCFFLEKDFVYARVSYLKNRICSLILFCVWQRINPSGKAHRRKYCLPLYNTGCLQTMFIYIEVFIKKAVARPQK